MGNWLPVVAYFGCLFGLLGAIEWAIRWYDRRFPLKPFIGCNEDYDLHKLWRRYGKPGAKAKEPTKP